MPKIEIKEEPIDYEFFEDIVVKEEPQDDNAPQDNDCQLVSIELKKTQVVIENSDDDDDDCMIVSAPNDFKPKQGFMFRINKRKRIAPQSRRADRELLNAVASLSNDSVDNSVDNSVPTKKTKH